MARKNDTEDPTMGSQAVKIRTLDPSDWGTFRTVSHRMLDDMLDYVQNIRNRPVWQPIPEQVRAQFRTSVPAGPADLAAVYGEFVRDI
jgi:aromatic-L-amino-acid decarboxylase